MCLLPQHAERLESAADLILHIHTYVSRSGQDNNLQASKWYNTHRSRRAELKVKLEIPNVMEKIINICWRKSKDIIRLSRWIRCLFQMTMTTFPHISLRCIDQASLIASKSRMDQVRIYFCHLLHPSVLFTLSISPAILIKVTTDI